VTNREPSTVNLAKEILPFPVGESPFRIKGSGYLLHLQYVDEHLPGGRPAMFAALADPKLRAFFEQTFFVSHLVDIFPLVVVGHTCARIQGVTFERFIRTRARHQAEGDLRLFRKLILRIASAEALATRIPASKTCASARSASPRNKRTAKRSCRCARSSSGAAHATAA